MKRLIYRSATFSLLSPCVRVEPGRGTEHGELQRHHRHPGQLHHRRQQPGIRPQGVLSTAVTSTSTLTVTCTNTTPYTVGLNAGTGTGNTEASRHMFGTVNTTASVAYQLYKADLSTVGATPPRRA